MTELSIIIPVYHALDDVKACLKSLEALDAAERAEILIVNDCPGSETADFLHQYAATHKVSVVDNESNLGFIKSCNRGMALAQGQVMVLLNSDTEVPRKLVLKFLDCFNSNPQIACAAPLGSVFEKSALPSDVEEADALAEKKAVKNLYYPTLVPNGFCFGIRKSVVQKIGGFDEIFGKGYCEENDLSMRALQAGYINVVMTNCYVRHNGAASFGSAERLRRIEANKKIFDARWLDFMHTYKKEHRTLYRHKAYLRRFRPWYKNTGLDLCRFGVSVICAVLPDCLLKKRLRSYK